MAEKSRSQNSRAGSASGFMSTAYFFAQKLNRKLKETVFPLDHANG